MKYPVGKCFITMTLAVMMSVWSCFACSGEAHYSLTHFLKTTDPVKLPASETLKTKGETIANNIHNAEWNAPLLRSPEGFEALRYAYENKLVDKNEFLDAQDYLQIQADFASPETEAFETLVTNGRLPLRVQAVSVKRIHYTNVATDEQPDILKSRGAIAGDKFGWLTEIVIDYAFSLNYDFVNDSVCKGKWRGDRGKCNARIYEDKHQQLFFWYNLLNRSTPGLSRIYEESDGSKRILLGSIPLYLEYLKKTKWYFLEFAPLYGQLDWNNLIEMRVDDVNPGTIYHPEVDNFFYPHGLYAGASAFVRHDLAHHKMLGTLSEEERQFMGWMHQQEEIILKKMDEAMVGFDVNTREAQYNTTNIPAAATMAKLCHSEREDNPFPHNKDDALPLDHYWAKPGNHRALFTGVFADMAKFVHYKTAFSKFMSYFDERWEDGYTNMEGLLKYILEEQCKDAGNLFGSSFDIYHAFLEDVLKKNKPYINSKFGISVDQIFLEIQSDPDSVQ